MSDGDDLETAAIKRMSRICHFNGGGFISIRVLELGIKRIGRNNFGCRPLKSIAASLSGRAV